MSAQSEQKAWEKEERKQHEAEHKRLAAEEAAEAEQEEAQAEQRPVSGQQDAVEPLVAPTPGTVIASTVTIDALFTSVFGTRSADLAATPIYSWSTGNSIIAQWPAVLTGFPAIFCRFEARQNAPSTISQ
jgi:hypothetical protein